VLGIPVCVYKLMVARVELEVTPQGLRTVQTGDTMIAWSSIEEVSLTWVSSVAFVVLVLSEPAYAELMDTTSGRVKSTANRLVIGERTIGLPNGLSAEPAALAKWLEAERVARSGPAR
jgi:hypothetical protein